MDNPCKSQCDSCKVLCSDPSKHANHWHGHKWTSPSTGDENQCRWWDKTQPEHEIIQIEVGDIYRDCSYHPVICTAVNGDVLEGKSLADGSGPRICSIENCGVIKLTQGDADNLVAVFTIDGERGLLRAAGWKEEAIEKFIKEWR